VGGDWSVWRFIRYRGAGTLGFQWEFNGENGVRGGA